MTSFLLTNAVVHCKLLMKYEVPKDSLILYELVW